MKTILITGSSGLLGGNLCHLLNLKGYKVIGTYNSICISIPGVEMVHIDSVKEIHSRIDFIIHCAAKTNVDACESDPGNAREVNVGLTEMLVNFGNSKNGVFIYISTDAVYKDIEGAKKEDAELGPLSVYAKTKLEAEEAVKHLAHKFYIIRTNLFGFNILDKKSLSEWVYTSLQEGTIINCFNDVHFSPILVNDLADALYNLLENQDHRENVIFNIGSISGSSKLQFAYHIAGLFSLNKNLIQSTSVRNFGFSAPRSMNSIMDSSKFSKLYNYNLPSLEEGLRNYKKLYNNKYPQLLKTFNI